MTKRDFELIASVIRQLVLEDKHDKLYLACCLADKLKETNSRFDRERFIAACMKKE